MPCIVSHVHHYTYSFQNPHATFQWKFYEKYTHTCCKIIHPKKNKSNTTWTRIVSIKRVNEIHLTLASRKSFSPMFKGNPPVLLDSPVKRYDHPL